MEEQYQQQNPYYQYPIQPEPQDLSLVEQTNPKEILLEIEMALRGKIYNKNKEEWILPLGAIPVVNDEGINSLMVDARGVINQNTILSNFSEEQISKLIIVTGRAIKNKIKMNYKEFGIDKSNLTTAVLSITHPAYAALMRAKNEGEKRFLKTSVRAIESFTSQSKPQQSSSSEKLKFWR